MDGFEKPGLKIPKPAAGFSGRDAGVNAKSGKRVMPGFQ